MIGRRFRNDEIRQMAAVFIYHRIRTIDNIRIRTPRHGKLFFQLLRTPPIITVKQRDPFPLREIKASVSCACNTHVLRIAQELNACILLCIALCDLYCAVSRTVIEDQQIPVFIRLGAHGSNGFPDVFLSIVCGHDHGNQRLLVGRTGQSILFHGTLFSSSLAHFSQS